LVRVWLIYVWMYLYIDGCLSICVQPLSRLTLCLPVCFSFFSFSRSRLRLAALKLVLTPAFEVVVIVACVLIYVWMYL